MKLADVEGSDKVEEGTGLMMMMRLGGRNGRKRRGFSYWHWIFF